MRYCGSHQNTLPHTPNIFLKETNGISAVIDHKGKVLAASPQFEVAVLDGKVQPQAGATPYVLVGNWPVLFGLFLALGVSGLIARRPVLDGH